MICYYSVFETVLVIIPYFILYCKQTKYPDNALLLGALGVNRSLEKFVIYK